MDSKIVESYLSSISKAMVVARRAAPSSVRLASNDQKEKPTGGGLLTLVTPVQIWVITQGTLLIQFPSVTNFRWRRLSVGDGVFEEETELWYERETAFAANPRTNFYWY